MSAVRSIRLFPPPCPQENFPATVAVSVNARMSLEEATAFMWRVKSWQFTNQINITELTYVASPVSEQQLVCGYFGWTVFAKGLINEQEQSVITGGSPGNLPVSIFGDLYYPPLVFQSGLGPPSTGTLIKTGYLTFVITSFDSSVTMSPAEWWPYDPDDGGGAIYDTATGAQIREFPQ